MPALAPHPGLVDASRHQRLHGRAYPLALAGEFEERGRIPAFDAQFAHHFNTAIPPLPPLPRLEVVIFIRTDP
jgi:hypothetical protein